MKPQNKEKVDCIRRRNESQKELHGCLI